MFTLPACVFSKLAQDWRFGSTNHARSQLLDSLFNLRLKAELLPVARQATVNLGLHSFLPIGCNILNFSKFLMLLFPGVCSKSQYPQGVLNYFTYFSYFSSPLEC